MDRITHFSHPHPLVLVSSSRWRRHTCGLCGHNIKDEFYQCTYKTLCSYSLHTSCAKFLEKMNHPFHPHHSLAYKEDIGRFGFWRKCGACGTNPYHEFAYFCEECEYALHLKCAALSPIGEVTETKLPDIIHQHSLLECEKTPWGHFNYYCHTCGEDFQNYERVYVCQKCPSLMHQICARLSKYITHPFHLQHPLELGRMYCGRKSRCDSCGEHKGNVFYYCFDCEFAIDVHCATLTLISQSHLGQQETLSLPVSHLHPHQLIECDNIKNFRRQCSGCNQPFKESRIHVCLDCSILLDTSCINSPPEISHPLHPQHPLILGKGDSRCNVCKKITAKYFYQCKECDSFSLDLKCAREKLDFVRSGIHEHDLAYFAFEFGGDLCSTCREWSNKFAFCCLQCNFYIHDHCYPSLPQTIKHECHCDPLTLSRSLIKDYPDQDVEGTDFYCFACEELRILDPPTYYCAECHFVAHVHCVISEVISYLQSQSKALPDPEKSKKKVETYPDTYFFGPSETSQNRNSDGDSEENDVDAAEENSDANPDAAAEENSDANPDAAAEEISDTGAAAPEEIKDANADAAEEARDASFHAAEKTGEENLHAAEETRDANPHAAEDASNKNVDPPVPQELDGEIALLQKKVDSLVAEISKLTAKIDKLKQRHPQSAAALELKLLEWNEGTRKAKHEQGHDQVLEPGSVSGS